MASTDVRQGAHDTGGLPAPDRPARPRPPWRMLISSPRLRRFYLWVAKPFDELPPAPRGRSARVALALVAAMAVAFVAFFTAYLWSLHEAYLTHAEDLGMMDQALWNTIHGAPLHQTVCNIVNDANCLGDISRLAIHFEPIMFPISLLYLVAPSPKTLQLFQALVVAAGAFPAYWLASRRLRSAFAGVVFAAVYLLFPSLEAAVTYDFHAVTLSAAFLMFALYFVLARNDTGLIIACLLALATKEEIVVDIAMIALCILVFQRRWRLGVGLLALSVVWLIVELAIMHAASPLGHSPTAGRYAYLGHGPTQAALYLLTHPLQILREHVFSASGIVYLRVLLAPVAYLALLSPLTLIIAVPALSINLLSADPAMYSGAFQYNAEIIPVLVFSAIQGVAYLSEAAGWFAERLQPIVDRALPAGFTPALTRSASRLGISAHGQIRLFALRSWVRNLATRFGRSLPFTNQNAHAPALAASEQADPDPARAFVVSSTEAGPTTTASYLAAKPPARTHLIARVTLVALALLTLAFSIYEQQSHGYLPLAHSFTWPQATAHSQLANSLLTLIPPDASVSAQSDLVPHVSHRRYIYMYPYHGTDADYIFLDVTGNLYPYTTGPHTYYRDVTQLLGNDNYHVVAATDGYLLFAKGPGPALSSTNPFGLPDSFFTFTRLNSAAAVPNRVDAAFGPSLRLVGYQVNPAGRIPVNTDITITTYWQVTAPLPSNTYPQLVFNQQDGGQGILSDFAATAWLPMSRWQPNYTYAVTTWPLFIGGPDLGRLRIGVRVIDASRPNAPPTMISPTLAGAGRAFIELLGGTQAVFFDQQIRR